MSLAEFFIYVRRASVNQKHVCPFHSKLLFIFSNNTDLIQSLD